MKSRKLRASFALSSVAIALGPIVGLGGCAGVDDPENFGGVIQPPSEATGNANPSRPASSAGGYGSYGGSGSQEPTTGGGGTTGDGTTAPLCVEDHPATCLSSFKLPFNGEHSVELRGDFSANPFKDPFPMAKSPDGKNWEVNVAVPNGKEVQYKFVIKKTATSQEEWIVAAGQPTSGSGAFTNNVAAPVTCGTTCPDGTTGGSTGGSAPIVGDFDWRDAVIYYIVVDRFADGDGKNPCAAAGVDSRANYRGGDWVGIKKKIDEGYFSKLGVNTLLLTSPMMNASGGFDGYLGDGSLDGHKYSGFHGYWPLAIDASAPSSCFGTPQDLKDLVTAAHAKGLRVMFDHVLTHVHSDAKIYKDNPSWFYPFKQNGQDCICGTSACPWENGSSPNKTCWFTPYLPHWNYNIPQAREASINAALTWVSEYNIDGMRLDAIKHVELSWLKDLRSAVQSKIAGPAKKRFYLVGETYSGSREALKPFIDPATMCDGQFDFGLRAAILPAAILPQGNMQGLAGYYEENERAFGNAIMSPFLGNHDMGRLIHFASGGFGGNVWENGKSDGWKNPAYGSPTDAAAYERVANGFAIMLTNPGAPTIYYGDEIGLSGAGDPDNRRSMLWDDTIPAYQKGLRDRISKILEARNAHPATRQGRRTTIKSTSSVWAYSLESAGDKVWVAVNRGDSPEAVDLREGGLKELLVGDAMKGTSADVPARQARIFVK